MNPMNHMRRRGRLNLFNLIERLFIPKWLQVRTLVNDTLIKQRELTGSAHVIYKGELFCHRQYLMDRLSNPHSTLLNQFDDCVAQRKELDRLQQRVSEYLSYSLFKHPNDDVYKYIPVSAHSWLRVEYKGKVSDDIPDWFTQLCAELQLLRIIYAND